MADVAAAPVRARVRAPLTPEPTPHFVARGESPARPVLMLHGWGADVTLFDPLVRDLGDGFRTIALDFPGAGETPEPTTPWSVDDHVLWVLDILDSLDISSVDIVAHSFGARVALKLAAAHPLRVGKLVLTGAAGIQPARGLAYHVRVRTFKIARRLAEARMAPGPIKRRAQRRVEAAGSRDYRAASGVRRGTFVRVINEDLRRVLPHVNASTLLVWGSDDDETPLADAHVMEAAIPDCGLVVFEGRGHYAYIDESARFALIVATFLGGHA